MDREAFEQMMEQWLQAARRERRPNDVIKKPDMLWHYEDGYRLGGVNYPRRVLRPTEPEKIEEYRGAHP